MRTLFFACISAIFLTFSTSSILASETTHSSGEAHKLLGIAAERPEWAAIFNEFDAHGTIEVVDGRTSNAQEWVHNKQRALKRYSPASTYKIPHTLIALDAGVVRDEFEIFEWDGIERAFSAHNRDQNLRSAMRHSLLWVYQKFDEAIDALPQDRQL